MRVVVADATPLHYLILIDAVRVLPRLFEKVHIPIEIRKELTHPAAPEAVRDWMQQPPSWLETLSVPVMVIEDESLIGLHEGERAAIRLAESMHADLLIIDDRAGAEIARRRGLTVTGTLGVLDLASRARLVRLREVVERLRKTNFRYPPSLMELLLNEERLRDSASPG
jgi:predicted nucleic acid-binding protein